MAPIRPKRLSSPINTSAMGSSGSVIEFPGTLNRGGSTGEGLNKIARPEHTKVPPSPATPGFKIPDPKLLTSDMLKAHTGAGVQKRSTKKSTRPSLQVETDAPNAARARNGGSASFFRFMDLPGEIRNMIYKHTHAEHRQALLVHRPRLASLRPRTRLDRGRTLPSDVAGHEQDQKLSSVNIAPELENGEDKNVPRDTNRPFWGLTQVCRQIRQEYRPIYMAHQEIGIDLTDVVNYIRAFYPSAPEEINKLTAMVKRTSDMPFIGNLTIAAGHMLKKQERGPEGIEVFPLLDVWANSIRMEAGFGRYMNGRYVPETDGEAKDLYRLFGRKVLRDRSCSDMNRYWRTILRTRALASVRIHRAPGSRSLIMPAWMFPVQNPHLILSSVAVPTDNGYRVVVASRPYIHLIFKKDKAEPWMTEFESVIPTDWLSLRGFGGMDHFDVKVGVEQDTAH